MCHLEGPQRTVEGSQLFDSLFLDSAPLRCAPSLVLGACIPHQLAGETEVLAHTVDRSHLQVQPHTMKPNRERWGLFFMYGHKVGGRGQRTKAKRHLLLLFIRYQRCAMRCRVPNVTDAFIHPNTVHDYRQLLEQAPRQTISL